MATQSTDTGTGRLTAADVMTEAPRNASPFSSVLEVVMIMRDQDCGAVPILDAGKAVGIVTDRDIALALAEYPDLASRPISEIMTKEVIWVAPEAPIDMVRKHLVDHAVRRVLVIEEDGTLRGIISWADLAPALPDKAVGRLVSNVLEQPPNPS